jgi:hypothetical protein
MYAWITESRASAKLILVPRGEYRVVWRRRWRNDPLSGLRLRLAEAEGTVDGRTVWRVLWHRGFYEAVFVEGVVVVELASCSLSDGGVIGSLEDFCRFIRPQA